jgi:hypothetical protein
MRVAVVCQCARSAATRAVTACRRAASATFLVCIWRTAAPAPPRRNAETCCVCHSRSLRPLFGNEPDDRQQQPLVRRVSVALAVTSPDTSDDQRDARWLTALEQASAGAVAPAIAAWRSDFVARHSRWRSVRAKRTAPSATTRCARRPDEAGRDTTSPALRNVRVALGRT